jgi:hypothetical protein
LKSQANEVVVSVWIDGGEVVQGTGLRKRPQLTGGEDTFLGGLRVGEFEEDPVEVTAAFRRGDQTD